MRHRDSLLLRLKAGDISAHDELVEQCWENLVRYAKCMLGSCQDAQDVVNQLFLDLLYHCHDLPDNSNLVHWLYRVTHNRACNYSRRRQREAPRDPLLIEAAEHPFSYDEVDSRVDLMACFDQLSAHDQSLLHLAYVEGRKPDELAQIFGVTPPAIRKRLQRARARLRSVYETRRTHDDAYLRTMR
jgi:RNA polymerase sigma-70 factor (ECF subfamily)